MSYHIIVQSAFAAHRVDKLEDQLNEAEQNGFQLVGIVSIETRATRFIMHKKDKSALDAILEMINTLDSASRLQLADLLPEDMLDYICEQCDPIEDDSSEDDQIATSTKETNSNELALAKYATLYNNKTYRAIRVAFAEIGDIFDSSTNPDDHIVTDIMNLVIDAALWRCGHFDYVSPRNVNISDSEPYLRLLTKQVASVYGSEEILAVIDKHLANFPARQDPPAVIVWPPINPHSATKNGHKYGNVSDLSDSYLIHSISFLEKSTLSPSGYGYLAQLRTERANRKFKLVKSLRADLAALDDNRLDIVIWANTDIVENPLSLETELYEARLNLREGHGEKARRKAMKRIIEHDWRHCRVDQRPYLVPGKPHYSNVLELTKTPDGWIDWYDKHQVDEFIAIIETFDPIVLKYLISQLPSSVTPSLLASNKAAGA